MYQSFIVSPIRLTDIGAVTPSAIATTIARMRSGSGRSPKSTAAMRAKQYHAMPVGIASANAITRGGVSAASSA